jgi:hypothetical protein
LKRKNDYDVLSQLAGFNDFPAFQEAHQKWVLAEMQKEKQTPESQWTEAAAVGSKSFMRPIKRQRVF